MIKCIIFDMDGVLCDLVEAHYKSLNEALETIAGKDFIITEKEQLFYNGLPTKVKLKKLIKDKNLNPELINDISLKKQNLTIKYINELLKEENHITELLVLLKSKGYLLACASNSIKNTIEESLKKMNIYHFFDCIISNEDVNHPKPNPEIYLKTFIKLNVSPKECVIVEDSYHGRNAAFESGAYVCDVDNVNQTTIKTVFNFINNIKTVKTKWSAKNSLTVLLPCAGAGSRFAAKNYKKPKPLIDVHGFPMIKKVINNLNINAEFIFIVQKEHYEKYYLDTILPLIESGCKIICVDGLTEGAAVTTLIAEEYINNDKHLLIANTDQYVEWDSGEFLSKAIMQKLDGLILTFNATGNKWSYVTVDGNNFVTQLAEKIEISNIATVGIYYFDKGSDYVKYAKQMIDKGIKYNNEYYVAPVYNEMIADNKKIGIHYCDKMYGIGTPEDLEFFLKEVKDDTIS